MCIDIIFCSAERKNLKGKMSHVSLFTSGLTKIDVKARNWVWIDKTMEKASRALRR